MKHQLRPVNRYFLAEGILAALFPFFIWLALRAPQGIDFYWPRLAAAGFAGGCELACAALLLRKPGLGKALGGCGLFGLGVLLWPWLAENPFLALLFLAAAVISVFALMDQHTFSAGISAGSERAMAERLTALGASVFVFLCCISSIFADSVSMLSRSSLAASGMVSLLLFGRWARKRERWLRRIGMVWCGIGGMIVLSGLIFPHLGLLLLIASLISTVLLLGFRGGREERENATVWGMILNYPARILFMTFFLLSILGSLLLNLPGAAQENVTILDAAFTAVSAVCVTGLVTLNTAVDFSGFGQFLLLVLFQLGGLGIMSIATVILHSAGHRLSLAQERAMAAMTDSDHRDLQTSLLLVLRFTFLTELAGALILAFAFYRTGSGWNTAVWKGTFTAVSAFCNAGFCLDSSSLMPYQNSGLILWTVGLLCFLGGLAPATSILIPRWIAGRPVPLTAQLALTMSVLLVLSGFVSFLAFEWNGIFSGLSLSDKWNNAWFLAMSARTAGFNAVDVGSMGTPTFLVIVFQMFVGGSPGGTAGGIRTTTLAVLALAFWTEICNKPEIIVSSRRISRQIVIRALTIAAASGVIVFAVLLMLLVTQPLPPRELLFEAVSALGTVGLSIGATPKLDGMGKIIIMLTMFVGRIGPMTLFLLLNDTRRFSSAYYPDAKVTLT